MYEKRHSGVMTAGQSRSAAFISFLIRDKEQDGVEYKCQILEE